MARINKLDKLPKLPRRSFVYILICGGGILSFFLIGIYPNQRAISAFEKEITTLNLKIREQKVLFPVFKNMINKIRTPDESKDTLLRKEKLRKENIGNLSVIFEKMAKKIGLMLEESVIDINTLKENKGLLKVTLSMSGEFFNFREFMIDLGTISYIERIGSLEIRTGQLSKNFKLSLWLSIE